MRDVSDSFGESYISCYGLVFLLTAWIKKERKKERKKKEERRKKKNMRFSELRVSLLVCVREYSMIPLGPV